MVEWQLFLMVATPELTLFLGIWVNRRFENRPKLLAHFGDISAFNMPNQNGDPYAVHTHSVVIRNAGRGTATNVRLSHSHLPDFNVWPRVPYECENVPNSGSDIVIPTVVPDQSLQISYLSCPPLTVADINTGVRSDEGFATQIPVLLQRQYPRWVNFTAAALMMVGVCTLVYGLFEVCLWIAEGLSS